MSTVEQIKRISGVNPLKCMKDINTLYGDYQAGLDPDSPAPLTSFRQDDAEPGVGRG